MAYFAPYIDGTGIHMPTYEERLEALTEAYRGIFGAGAELSAAAPDYQLLSVFARALDDVSALVLKAYNSRNPAYASGQALDLLLPQYGLTREAGEGIRFLHDRMPLMLPETLIREWIRPENRPEDLLEAALTEIAYEKAV